MTQPYTEVARLQSWYEMLERGKKWIGDAGVRDVDVDVRVPDWSYRFRCDHKVFVYPTEYVKPVVVTTWANFVECVKNAAGPNVVHQNGQHTFYDLSYERSIGSADLSCITRENHFTGEHGKETEEYYDDFCVWVEAAALAQYGSGVVSVCDEVPDSMFDSAALQTLIGVTAQSQQYVYVAPWQNPTFFSRTGLEQQNYQQRTMTIHC